MAINSLQCFQNDHLMMIHRYIYVLQKLKNQNPIISEKKKIKNKRKKEKKHFMYMKMANFSTFSVTKKGTMRD